MNILPLSKCEFVEKLVSLNFTFFWNRFIKQAECYILVFSITDKSSFDDLQNYHTIIQKVKDTDLYCGLLVGTKSDLVNERQ